MARIHLLSDDVINQIAAGEVVERPSHLIKELLENSLDAGASKIEIEIQNGGRNIRISDNGSGIEPQDLKLALQRHATSKIKESKDLFELHSYGFRGEALSSIAAVSDFKMISKVMSQDHAYQLHSEFGKMGELEVCGANAGTSVCIENLFENLPARLKFLKSEAAEVNQIKQTIKAFALIHPEIEVRLKIQSADLSRKPQTIVYAKNLDNLKRIQEVLELKKMYQENLNFEGMKVQITFSSPQDVVGQSRQIYIFVQKRWVQDRGIQAAVMEAYRGLLMHGEFPICVVDLELDPQEVDVNIHPTKSQVKFKNSSSVFRIVQRALRQGLEKAPWIEEKYEQFGFTAPLLKVAEPSTYLPKTTEVKDQEHFAQSKELYRTQLRQKHFDVTDEKLSLNQLQSIREQVESNPNFEAHLNTSMPDYADTASSKSASIITSTSEQNIQNRFWSSLMVLGQAHQTYILAQNNENLIIVDQHAAHERVVFETLMRDFKNQKIEVQSFLLPIPLRLEEREVEALSIHQQELQSLGIEWDISGPEHIAIRSAPSLVKESALTEAIKKMAQDCLDQGGSFALEKSVMEVFARMACHSAIRAGQALSIAEMKSLLCQMDEFSLSSFCPHGRPVMIEYPFFQIEKDFGRIV